MSSGPKNVTSTTSNEPPAFLLGPLTQAVNAASSDFNRQTGGQGGVQPSFGGGQFGSLFGQGGVAGLGSLGISGLGSLAGGGGNNATQTNVIPGGTPANGGSTQLIDQGQDLLGRTINGDFLSPDSNPFLEDTFNRAADLTRTRLSSEFAGSGRDLGAAQPARSEELQTLSSNIFGQNFQAERDRQLQGLNTSLDFDPINLLINRLGGIIPGAGGTTTSQQPVFRSGLFSDRRLKTDIKRIGTVASLPWYSFRYIWGQVAEGFMSDEVPAHCVQKDASGYDVVDYGLALGG